MRMAPILKSARLTLVLTITCILGCHRGSGGGSASGIIAGTPADQTAPAVSWFFPENAKTGVPINSSVLIQFSEAMDPASLTSSSVVFVGPAGIVAGSLSLVAEKTLVWTAASPLIPLSLYTASVNSGSKDLAGNALAAAASWSFTTGASSDIFPPSVSLEIPSPGATDVPYTLTAVSVAFSEVIDPSTVTDSTFFVEVASVPVPGIVLAGSTGATFVFTSPLAPFTSYQAKVTTGVKDLAGNALPVDEIWSFTTGPLPDTTAPSVILTTPENGASGVPINTASLVAAFDEAMNGATLNSATFTLETGAGAVLGSVSFSGTTIASFLPTATLTPLTSYTAKITTGAQDNSGNGLATLYSWSFTTGPGPDVVAPAVAFTTPANLDNSVALSATVSAAFSEAMDPLSITAASFQVKKAGVPLAGSLATGPTAATFTPAAPFSLLGSYTGSLSSSVKDLAGNALPATNWSFTARDGVWGTAAVLGANPANGKLDLGMDGAGNAIAIWQRDDSPSTDDHLFVRRYSASTSTWSTDLQIDTASTAAIDPHLATSSNGSAIAIWEQNNGTTNYSVLVRRFDSGTLTWGSPVTLFTNSLSTRVCLPQIAIDAAGNAFAAWIGTNVASQLSLYTARYNATSASWGVPALMESATDPVTSFRIAMNDAGDALLVFGQGPGSTAKNIYGLRYKATLASWGSAALLDLGAGAVTSPAVAIDSNGNGVAVWIQKNTVFGTYANHFDAGTGLWQGEVNLDLGSVAATPAVAMDGLGNAIAAWESGTPLTLLNASRYNAGSSSWSAFVTLSDSSGNAATPSVALAPDGNGLVLWSQKDGVQNNILASRFTVASTSFAAPLFAETAPRNATTPIVVIGGPQNKAKAIWKQLSATASDLWINLFQ